MKEEFADELDAEHEAGTAEYEADTEIPNLLNLDDPDTLADDLPIEPKSTRRDDKKVRQAFAAKLAAAKQSFQLPPEPANDNEEQERPPKESWPLLEQINRKTFESDTYRRAQFAHAARRIRSLIEISGVDALSLSVHLPGKQHPADFDLQRSAEGGVHFEFGQTLDRNSRTYDAKNGESEALRHDGSVRTAARTGRVDNSGFDPHRDDPVAFAKIQAFHELEEIAVSCGPLWPYLFDAVENSKSFTDIGQALGAKHTQASGVGTAVIRLALSVAVEAIERFAARPPVADSLDLLKKRPDWAPVPARKLKLAYKELRLAEAA